MKTKIQFKTGKFRYLTVLEINVMSIIFKVKKAQYLLEGTQDMGCYFTLDAGTLVPNAIEMNLSIATVFINGNKFYIKFLSNDALDYFETEEFEIDAI